MTDTCTRPVAGQQQSERLDAAHAAARLPNRCRDRLRVGDVTRRELDVEGDQQRAGADQHGAGTRVEPRRAERRLQLAGVDTALQLGRAAAAEEGRPQRRPRRAVEEHRQAELVADTPPERDGDLDRELHLTGSQRHDRDDVGRTDPRVDAVVRPQVDQLRRRVAIPAEQRFGQPSSSATIV